MISMISMISKISMISIDFYYQLIKCQTKVPFLGKIFTIYENLVGLQTTQRSTALNTMRKRLSLVLRSVAKRKLPLFQNILIRRTRLSLSVLCLQLLISYVQPPMKPQALTSGPRNLGVWGCTCWVIINVHMTRIGLPLPGFRLVI